MKKMLVILLFLLALLAGSKLCWAQNEWTITYSTNAAQTNYVLKAAPVTGLCLYITDILITNGATAGEIKLLNGSGGTVIWRVYLPVNGFCVISLITPIKLTAATALCLTSVTVTTHGVTINGIIKP